MLIEVSLKIFEAVVKRLIETGEVDVLDSWKYGNCFVIGGFILGLRMYHRGNHIYKIDMDVINRLELIK